LGLREIRVNAPENFARQIRALPLRNAAHGPHDSGMICDEAIALIRTYDDLIAAIRGRIVELQTTYEGVDAVAGLADRHVSKLMCQTKTFGPMSLTCVLQALGLALVVVSEGEQLERVRSRLPRRRAGGDRRSSAFKEGREQPRGGA
jgi:hypothetical protein